MSVRLRLALTVLLTGLASALGVLVTVALAMERVERETTFARADAFVERVVARHDDLLDQHRVDPDGVSRFLGSLLLFDPGSQLYLLGADGTVLARTGVNPLPPGYKVSVAPVRVAAAAASAVAAGGESARRAAYVMGDDPEYMHADAVIAARALRRITIGPGRSEPDGYLYLVSRTPGLPASRLAQLGTHLAGAALVPVLAVMGLASLLAAWIIGAVTRPLAVLSREVDEAAQAGFDAPLPPPDQAAATRHDEIGRLRQGYAALMARLRRQWDQLRQLDAFRRESVSNLSHDLRSPLTATVASLETLQQRWGRPAGGDAAPAHDDDRRLLEVALRNTHSAARLVRQLGDLAVLDEAQFRLRLTTLDLLEVLDDIVARFAERARERALDLVLDGGPDPQPAQVDVELFERAIANVLDNALRHTPPGGRVRLSLRHEGPRLRVAVHDSGPGIAAADIAHLFDRHVQGRDGARGSHGLGLAIVKRIVELHDGTVKVDSAPGQGTTVTLSWPAAGAGPDACA